MSTFQSAHAFFIKVKINSALLQKDEDNKAQICKTIIFSKQKK